MMNPGAGCKVIAGDYKGIRTPLDLYTALSEVWCAETCAPRMRKDWTKENYTLGQCSVTAFLAQDLFGGKVYGVPLENGGFHCFNVVGEEKFDLTDEQFGGRELIYDLAHEQLREVHFAAEEKKERYELLKSRLAVFCDRRLKIALVGQDIPTLLPSLLADLLFAGKEAHASVTVFEENEAMREVLQGYGDAASRKAGLGGTFRACGDLPEALTGSDCVIYAGDCQPGSRFAMDRSALGTDDEDDPGLEEQARVNGGIGGLLHALRAGEMVLRLCDEMDKACPEAVVINLGQPVARTTGVFLKRGYRCFGMGRTPLKDTNGLDTLLKRMKLKPDTVETTVAGLPGFAFLCELRKKKTGEDLLPKLKKAAEKGELGELSKRWLGWWDAVPVGDVTEHAEFLPAQEDYIPEERPEFGESVERRKERILYMNTVREQGMEAGEGAMAQLLLLSKVPPIRPMRLALALLKKESAVIPAVTHENRGEIEALPPEAIVETELRLEAGEMIPHGLAVNPELGDILTEVDEANRLAAEAAFGDREAVREYAERDVALMGLDRLYCLDVINALIALHGDVLKRFPADEMTE